MANNQFSVTVSPEIPSILPTEQEIRFLGACGFAFDSGNCSLYFYAEEFANIEDDPEIPEEYEDDSFPAHWSVPIVLQNILRRSEGALKEIILEGAFTCDKMRMGQFGGVVYLITANRIQKGCTHSLLEQFRKEGEFKSHVFASVSVHDIREILAIDVELDKDAPKPVETAFPVLHSMTDEEIDGVLYRAWLKGWVIHTGEGSLDMAGIENLAAEVKQNEDPTL